MKQKLGFLHIPRTGGTYLESIISEKLNPTLFINFFGTPNDQRPNKISIVENIAKDKRKQIDINKLQHWKTCKVFSGHFSLNIEKYLPKEYSYKYFTIVRDPLDRVISFVKKVTTSRTFRDYLCEDGAVGDDNFWYNYKIYVQEQKTVGLMPHERNGFNNYMTKVFAGLDLSNPYIEVDNNIYNMAIANLSKFVFIGKFEQYPESVSSILNICNIQSQFTHRKSNPKNIPSQVLDFIKERNRYDIKLYKKIFENV
jgi:hypothetical protein